MSVPGNRVNDLYTVNTTAGWAKDQLAILADMLAEGSPPASWVVEEVRRIRDGIATVHGLEDEREKRRTAKPEPKTLAPLDQTFRDLAEASGGRWDGVDANAYVDELRKD